MIEAHFPSIRKRQGFFGTPFVMGKPPKQFEQPVVTYPTYPDTRILNIMESMDITYEEYKRRDEVIQELFRMCPFIKGDRVIPKDADKRKKYGTMEIVGICRNLAEMEHDKTEWPKNDNPLIVTCTTQKEGEIMCTTNFFIKAPHGGKC